MKNMKKQAQSLIEYGLILALVAVVAVVILGKFGKSMTDAGNRTSNTIDQTSSKAMDNYCASVTTGGTYSTTEGKCTTTNTGSGTTPSDG